MGTFLGLLAACLCCSVLAQQPSVTIPLGTIHGFDHTTVFNNFQSEIFLGIPYAQPPVGNLRFEKPLDPLPFGQLNATEFGPICIPHTRLAVPPNTVASEDCLTLNIIRPKNRTSEKLPVLVWIHDGGFETGSAQNIGYKGFADFYTIENIIVVTIQYRLGPLGFFSGVELNGNYGLFDQAKALEFVINYIEEFGGDNYAVTAGGLGAGGCSASLLAISPITEHMVHRSIEMSGNAFSYLGVGDEVGYNSVALALALGCRFRTEQACLKNKTLDEIYNAVETIGYTTNMTLGSIKWGPNDDQGIVYMSPFVMAQKAFPKPVLTGVSDKPSGYFSIFNYGKTIQNLGINATLQSQFDRDELIRYIKTLVPPEYFGSNTSTAWDMMIDRYAPPVIGTPSFKSAFYLNKYNMWLNSFYYFAPTVDGILTRRDLGWPVYAYQFNHYNPQLFTDRGMSSTTIRGSFYSNEYTYLFGMYPMGEFVENSFDKIVRNQLVGAISSFVKTGKPKVPGSLLGWPEVGNLMTYMKFPAALLNGIDFYGDEYRFIEKLRKLGFDMGFLEPSNEVGREKPSTSS